MVVPISYRGAARPGLLAACRFPSSCGRILARVTMTLHTTATEHKPREIRLWRRGSTHPMSSSRSTTLRFFRVKIRRLWPSRSSGEPSARRSRMARPTSTLRRPAHALVHQRLVSRRDSQRELGLQGPRQKLLARPHEAGEERRARQAHSASPFFRGSKGGGARGDEPRDSGGARRQPPR